MSYNPPMHRHVERVVDLLDPHVNHLHNMDVDEARRRVLSGDPAAVRGIDGSFALVAVDGRHRPDGALARSADALLPREAHGGSGAVRRRPHRHAAAARSKTTASTASFIRATPAWCRRTTSSSSRWSGCPDPDPIYTRFFTPERGTLPRRPRRDRPALRRRAGRRDREVAAAHRSPRRRRRSASASRAASTAARCSS